MKHIGLFEGIGGFSLAARMAGIETVFTSEINPFCRRVLQYHFPKAYHAGDIHEITKEFIHEKAQINESDIVILTGGFPCQPFSLAGKRKGTNDSRHLWPQMLRIIREVKPTYIVGENVGGFISWNNGELFESVCNDLENEGYEVQTFEIPACAVGAPHIRNRVWIVANRLPIQREPQIGMVFSELENGFRESDITNTTSKGLERNDWIESKQSEPAGHCQFKLSQSPFCGANDGLPAKLDGITFSKWRNESIKAYGNAIVPQIAYAIFKAIKDTMAL